MSKINQKINYTLEDWVKDQSKYYKGWMLLNQAKYMQRCYANIFNRKVRSYLINSESSCAYCQNKESLQIDHIIPISKGGRNHLSNIQVLCAICNNKKRSNV